MTSIEMEQAGSRDSPGVAYSKIGRTGWGYLCHRFPERECDLSTTDGGATFELAQFASDSTPVSQITRRGDLIVTEESSTIYRCRSDMEN